jgi:hypothetical protein
MGFIVRILDDSANFDYFDLLAVNPSDRLRIVADPFSRTDDFYAPSVPPVIPDHNPFVVIWICDSDIGTNQYTHSNCDAIIA